MWRRFLAFCLLALALALAVQAGPDPLIGVSAQDEVRGSHRAAVERWAAFLGRPLEDIGHIQENIFAASWAELEGSAVAYLQRENNWRGFDEAFKARFELNVPMFPGSGEFGPANETKWGLAAQGHYAAPFRRLAENLVEAGFGRAALRLGWEFNGTGGQFPWHIQSGDASAQQRRAGLFVRYWRGIHHTMMGVPGAAFRWVWCPMIGENQSFDPFIAWPGDAFVDVVSADIYDAHGEYYWADPDELKNGRDAFLELSAGQRTFRRELAWGKWVLGKDYDLGAMDFRAPPPSYRGLDWLYAGAKKRGKKFALSEWGIWPRYVRLDAGGAPVFSTLPPGGAPSAFGYSDSKELRDNPDFIARMKRWIDAHEVEWACYFDVRLAKDGGSERIDHSLSPRTVGGVTASQHPRAAAQYRALFGAGKKAPAARQ